MKRTILAAILAIPMLLFGAVPGFAAVPEPYPLLLFRNITYFPMTWHSHNEFGWETSWDSVNGLRR